MRSVVREIGSFIPLPQQESDVEDDTSEEDRSGTSEEEVVETNSNSGVEGFGFVEILCQDVVLDDNDATVVLVFPHGKGYGGREGAIDPDELVEDPWKQARRIFNSDAHMHTGFEAFPPECSGQAITQSLYQRAVRHKVVEMVMQMGLRPSSFQSIDGDEAYLKIAVDPDGAVIRHLAAAFSYQMPFTSEAYELMEGKLGQKRGPPTNDEGDAVHAYCRYIIGLRGKFQPFRDVDLIRLVMRILCQHISLAELQKQRVITNFFPAAKHEKIRELHSDWLNLRKLLFVQSSSDADQIRDYFGEEVAFFFQYYAFYIRMLVPLAAIAGLVIPFEIYFKRSSHQAQNFLKVAFGICLALWATLCEVWFEYRAARARQRWGMDKYAANIEPSRAAYQPELEGTWMLKRRKLFASSCVIFAWLLFSATWSLISVHLRKEHEYIATTTLVKIFNLLWGYVAPWLVEMKNHRTQRSYNKSMAWTLTLVKLFCYLSPFLRIAFLMNVTFMTCAPTLEEVADKVFTPIGWPKGVHPSHVREWLHEYTMPAELMLGPLNITIAGTGQTCLWGCIPRKCRLASDGSGTASCLTNCYFTLRGSLDYLYFTHIGSTSLFLLIGIWKARRYVMSEMRGATREGSQYTFLQFQAKCCEAAPYQYFSYGGSQVEDFLEVVLGFALLTCFGIIRPWLAPTALVSQTVEYMLLAIRMMHVTARPYPSGTQGIDMWRRIISTIGVLSVIVNAALAVFMLRPMDTWDAKSKLILFLAYGLVMLGIRQGLLGAFRKTPPDVGRIEETNGEFMRRMAHEQDGLDVPTGEDADASGVNVELEADAVPPCETWAAGKSRNLIAQFKSFKSFALLKDV